MKAKITHSSKRKLNEYRDNNSDNNKDVTALVKYLNLDNWFNVSNTAAIKLLQLLTLLKN